MIRQSNASRCLIHMFAAGVLVCTVACQKHSLAIAVIPRTTATPNWEYEFLGVQNVARASRARIYWNAPTREDDVEGQISLVAKVMSEGYDGLILSPDSATALSTTVRRVVDGGTPVVVVGSPLAVPPSANLCYVLNDEEAGARLAAQRLREILHGKGTFALLGVNPDVIGIIDRARSLISVLGRESPQIHLVDERRGTFDEDHERQVSLDFLDQHTHVDAIIALSSATTHGLLEALSERSVDPATTKIIAFDRDDDDRLLFDSPSIDSIVMQDTQSAGEEAARQILRRLDGRSMCAQESFKPLLLTRQNLSEQMHRLRSDIDSISPKDRWLWMVNQ